jgi:short-subunit dehydrogenase
MKKLIVITGGTKGIGKALVNIFAKNEFDVITCSRNQEDLNQLEKDLRSKRKQVNVSTLKADLSQRKEVNNFIDHIQSYDRPVDVLINNVGVFLPGEISNEADGALETMMATNVYSAYYLTRGLIGNMMKEKNGYIFNICSTASITPYVNGGSYCISKYALLGMSKVLREEMKSYNIKVTSVLPGATLTASWDGVDIPPERFMKSEDVASSIWNAYIMSSRTVVEEIILRPQMGDI